VLARVPERVGVDLRVERGAVRDEDGDSVSETNRRDEQRRGDAARRREASALTRGVSLATAARPSRSLRRSRCGKAAPLWAWQRPS